MIRVSQATTPTAVQPLLEAPSASLPTAVAQAKGPLVAVAKLFALGKIAGACAILKELHQDLPVKPLLADSDFLGKLIEDCKKKVAVAPDYFNYLFYVVYAQSTIFEKLLTETLTEADKFHQACHIFSTTLTLLAKYNYLSYLKRAYEQSIRELPEGYMIQTCIFRLFSAVIANKANDLDIESLFEKLKINLLDIYCVSSSSIGYTPQEACNKILQTSFPKLVKLPPADPVANKLRDEAAEKILPILRHLLQNTTISTEDIKTLSIEQMNGLLVDADLTLDQLDNRIRQYFNLPLINLPDVEMQDQSSRKNDDANEDNASDNDKIMTDIIIAEPESNTGETRQDKDKPKYDVLKTRVIITAEPPHDLFDCRDNKKVNSISAELRAVYLLFRHKLHLAYHSNQSGQQGIGTFAYSEQLTKRLQSTLFKVSYNLAGETLYSCVQEISQIRFNDALWSVDFRNKFNREFATLRHYQEAILNFYVHYPFASKRKRNKEAIATLWQDAFNITIATMYASSLATNNIIVYPNNNADREAVYRLLWLCGQYSLFKAFTTNSEKILGETTLRRDKGDKLLYDFCWNYLNPLFGSPHNSNVDVRKNLREFLTPPATMRCPPVIEIPNAMMFAIVDVIEYLANSPANENDIFWEQAKAFSKPSSLKQQQSSRTVIAQPNKFLAIRRVYEDEKPTDKASHEQARSFANDLTDAIRGEKIKPVTMIVPSIAGTPINTDEKYQEQPLLVLMIDPMNRFFLATKFNMASNGLAGLNSDVKAAPEILQTLIKQRFFAVHAELQKKGTPQKKLKFFDKPQDLQDKLEEIAARSKGEYDLPTKEFCNLFYHWCKTRAADAKVGEQLAIFMQQNAYPERLQRQIHARLSTELEKSIADFTESYVIKKSSKVRQYYDSGKAPITLTRHNEVLTILDINLENGKDELRCVAFCDWTSTAIARVLKLQAVCKELYRETAVAFYHASSGQCLKLRDEEVKHLYELLALLKGLSPEYKSPFPQSLPGFPHDPKITACWDKLSPMVLASEKSQPTIDGSVAGSKRSAGVATATSEIPPAAASTVIEPPEKKLRGLARTPN